MKAHLSKQHLVQLVEEFSNIVWHEDYKSDHQISANLFEVD